MAATAEAIKTEIPEEVNSLVSESQKLLADAKSFQITTAHEYDLAGTDLKRIKDRMRELDAQRKELTRPLDAAKKKIMDFFRKPEQFLKDAESVYKRSMLSFQAEQQRKAREEQERLRRLQQAEQERLAREAEALEQAGDHATANAIIEQAATMPEAIVPVEQVKVDGVKTRTTWTAELIDKQAVIKAVAEGEIPMVALEVNMTFFRQQAVSLKDAFNYPGIKAVAKQSIAA